MTTKDDHPNRLAQILESPVADQIYPRWDEEKVWSKTSRLVQILAIQRRRFWLWLITLGLLGSIPGADHLVKFPQRYPPANKPKTPIAQVEATFPKTKVPATLVTPQAPSLKQTEFPGSPKPAIPIRTTDSTKVEDFVLQIPFTPVPPVSHLDTLQEVHSQTVKFQIPPKPWRKKHSTVYTLKLPETPLNWNVYNTFVQHVDQTINSMQLANGWMAFQIQREAGAAFTLVHRSRDTLSVQDIEIHLHSNNR